MIHPAWIVLLSLPLFAMASALVALIVEKRRDAQGIAELRLEILRARKDIEGLQETLDRIEIRARSTTPGGERLPAKP